MRAQVPPEVRAVLTYYYNSSTATTTATTTIILTFTNINICYYYLVPTPTNTNILLYSYYPYHYCYIDAGMKDGDREPGKDTVDAFRVPREMGILQQIFCEDSDCGGGKCSFVHPLQYVSVVI